MPGSFDLKGISSSAPCSSITVFRHGNLFSHLLHSFSLPGNMRATYSLAGKGEREKNLELIFLSAPAPSPLFPLLARFLSRIPRENCEKNLNSAARVLITATLRRLCVILKSSGAKEVFRPDVYFLAPVIIRRQNFHGFSSPRLLTFSQFQPKSSSSYLGESTPFPHNFFLIYMYL